MPSLMTKSVDRTTLSLPSEESESNTTVSTDTLDPDTEEDADGWEVRGGETLETTFFLVTWDTRSGDHPACVLRTGLVNRLC